MILAGIDIGTNTIRLLIADVSTSTHRELYSGRTITRLGQNLDRTGVLDREACERSLAALAGFSREIGRHAVGGQDAVGTSALRNAANAAEFLQRVRERTGIIVRVISGEEEARLTLLGVMRAVGQAASAADAGRSLVIDIGGGSTEMILTGGAGAPQEASLPLGAVYLTERFISHDPPEPAELEALRQTVRQELDRQGGFIPSGLPASLVGTAGTVTTLAAMDQEMPAYDPGRINGYVLTKDALDRLVRRLSTSSLAERRAMKGLEPGREDIILAGALTAWEVMERCRADRMLVSDWGLREGIVFDLYRRLKQKGRDQHA